jgi:outer membrane protein TolC
VNLTTLGAALAALLAASPAAQPAPVAPAPAVTSPPSSAAAGDEFSAADVSGVPVLTLAAALDELDRQSLTLIQARSRADEARAVARQSAAALLPTLGASVSYLANSDAAQFDRPGAGTIVIQPRESFTAAGSARVPLVVPNAWFDLAQARDAARGAAATAEAARLQLRTGFAQAAYAAAAGEELVVASEAAFESAAELARSAARRVEAGTAAPLDALRAETERVRRESDLVRARAELERARLALGVLLGRDGPVRVVVPELAAAPVVEAGAQPGALAEEALARRPELRAAGALEEAAEAGVRSARARLAPQLSASGAIFASDVPYPTGERRGWRATVDLTWTLYDGGFRYGKRDQAEAQAVAARAAADAQRLAVRQEVEDALRDVRVADQRLRLAETQRRLASDAAASARRSFDAGVASSLDVIDANDRRYVADTGRADARARLAAARLALERALGRGR